MNVLSFHASEWWILVSTPCVTWPFKQIWLLDSYSNTTFSTWLTQPLIILIFFVTENKAIGVMKPGHTFTIEPMISQGEL